MLREMFDHLVPFMRIPALMREKIVLLSVLVNLLFCAYSSQQVKDEQ